MNRFGIPVAFVPPFVSVSTRRIKVLAAITMIATSVTAYHHRAAPCDWLTDQSIKARAAGHFAESHRYRELALKYAQTFNLGQSYISNCAFNMANICHKSGHVVDAEKYGRLALQTSAKASYRMESIDIIAEALEEQGKYTDAMEFWTMKLAYDAAEEVETWKMVSDLNELAGVKLRHADNGANTLGTLLKIDSKTSPPFAFRDLSRLAYCAEKSGQAEDALRLRMSALYYLSPSTTEKAIATAVWKAGKDLKSDCSDAEIKLAYQPVLQLVNGSKTELNELEFLHKQAYILNDMGRLREAEHLFRNHLLLTSRLKEQALSQRANCLYNLATCLRRQGRFEESAACEEKAEVLYTLAGDLKVLTVYSSR